MPGFFHGKDSEVETHCLLLNPDSITFWLSYFDLKTELSVPQFPHLKMRLKYL